MNRQIIRVAWAVTSFLACSTAAAESLQVTLAPAAAVELQARWRLQGETRWRPSTDVADGLRPGPVTIELNSLVGCTPKSTLHTVNIVQNETLHVTLEYEGPNCPAPAEPAAPLLRR